MTNTNGPYTLFDYRKFCKQFNGQLIYLNDATCPFKIMGLWDNTFIMLSCKFKKLSELVGLGKFYFYNFNDFYNNYTYLECTTQNLALYSDHRFLFAKLKDIKEYLNYEKSPMGIRMFLKPEITDDILKLIREKMDAL